MFQQSILKTDFIFLSILLGLSLNAFGQKNKKQLELERIENSKKYQRLKRFWDKQKTRKRLR